MTPHRTINSGPPWTGACRHANLRICTHIENSRNQKLIERRALIGAYKGVSQVGRRWRAHICVNGKLRHLGRFDAPEAAAAAYDEAARELHGEFARLNTILTEAIGS